MASGILSEPSLVLLLLSVFFVFVLSVLFVMHLVVRVWNVTGELFDWMARIDHRLVTKDAILVSSPRVRSATHQGASTPAIRCDRRHQPRKKNVVNRPKRHKAAMIYRIGNRLLS